MGVTPLKIDNITVRLAESRAEIEAAQHLRYKVFYEEFKAIPNDVMAASRRDFDAFDDVADHLIVVNNAIPDPHDRIIGTYRMMSQTAADRLGRFYTSGEFDISPLEKSGTKLLELGRSCVLAEYRTRPVLQLLWGGIADYMMTHDIGLMFGCASLHGTDVDSLALPLSYLYHYHMSPSAMRPRALDGQYVEMNRIPKDEIDVKKAFNSLPPLIKGYLRVGTTVGDGAVIDSQFNTTDVCIMLDTTQIQERYRKHYGRKTGRDIMDDVPEKELVFAAEGSL